MPAFVEVAPEPTPPPPAVAEIEDEDHSVDDDSSDVEVEVEERLEVEVIVELANVVEAKVDERMEDNSDGDSVELEKFGLLEETDVDVDRSDEVEEDEVNDVEESDAGLTSARDI